MTERRLGLALACAAAVFAGCGGAEPRASKPPAAEPLGPKNQGSVVQFADCGHWNKGTLAEKRATVIELRGQLTAQTSQSAVSPLADDRALEILDGACTPDYAKSLRLYKLYVRAQAFAPLNE